MLDCIISGANIIDGTGAPPFRGDVGIEGAKIAAVGDLSMAQAERRLQAGGRVLTPGFIDIHRHGDGALFTEGFGEAELMQGLTTVVNGCCGMSIAPVSGPYAQETLRYLLPVTGAAPGGAGFASVQEYMGAAASTHPAINCALSLGMGTLRACIAGFRADDLSDEEYLRLHRGIERALEEGAMGVSLGLGYAPECFYGTRQLLRSLEPLKGSGVVVSVHMRQEGDGVVEALSEMIYIARELRTPVHISHLKSIGRHNWRKRIPVMLCMIDRAREQGLDISADVYPYSAGSTQLMHLLPPEFKAGGVESIMESLADEHRRAAMKERMRTASDFENIALLVGFDNVKAISLHSEEYRGMEGYTISRIAELTCKDPYDALFDVLAAERCAPGMIDRITDDEDIAMILSRPYSIVVSDATYPDGLCHPRLFGNCSRLIETWALKRGVLTLHEAVHRMTGLPAQRYSLDGKGRIAPGADADLCLFCPGSIRERATFGEPRRFSEGMDAVFVGGRAAVLDGRLTGERGGRML